MIKEGFDFFTIKIGKSKNIIRLDKIIIIPKTEERSKKTITEPPAREADPTACKLQMILFLLFFLSTDSILDNIKGA